MTGQFMSALRAVVIPVTPFQQNCLLLYDGDTMRGTIIDPGGDVAAIMQAIGDTGVSVDAIVLTHGHLDHAGGADELRDRLKVDIIGPHREDKFLLDAIAAQGRMYNIEGMRDCAPDRWLEEGDKVDLAGVPFDVLHCPGHTPGHLAFVNAGMKLAIVGDVLFRGAVGRTDFPRSSHAALVASIRTKLYTLDDDVTVLCGHGDFTTIGAEKQSNPFVPA
jgi:hydroxyacylglutathione hydrolase